METNESLKQENAGLQKVLEVNENEYKMRDAEMAATQERVNFDLTAIQHKLDGKIDEVNTLKRLLEASDKQLKMNQKRTQDLLESTSKTHQESRLQVMELETAYSKIQAEMGAKDDAALILQTLHDELKKKHEALQSENNDYENTLEGLESKIGALVEKVTLLEQEIQDRQNSAKAKDEQCIALNLRLEESKDEISKLRQENEKTSSNLLHMKRQKNDDEVSKEKQAETIASLTESLNKKHQVINTLTARCTKLESMSNVSISDLQVMNTKLTVEKII